MHVRIPIIEPTRGPKSFFSNRRREWDKGCPKGRVEEDERRDQTTREEESARVCRALQTSPAPSFPLLLSMLRPTPLESFLCEVLRRGQLRWDRC